MKRERVIFCGENPELRLYREGTEEVVALASYWRSVYSAHGQGHALFVWAAPKVAPAIYADNEPLARFLAQRMVQHFDGFQELGFGSLTPKQARFVQAGEGRHDYRVLCYGDEGEIEIVWRDILDYRLPHTYANLFQRTEQEVQYDVLNVICPAADGSFTLNGNTIPGRVNSFHDGTTHRSSAFLAFSETWIERSVA